MAKDQQGLSLTGLSTSAEAFDRSVADYYGVTGDPVGILKSALGRDPAFALGGVAVAGFYMIGGFRADHPEVAEALGAARAAIGGASAREKLHLKAVEAWGSGRLFEAAAVWEQILLDCPTDALALRFLHDAYIFTGQSLALRDSVARVLPAWDPQNPLTSFLLGLYAYGLEESGDLRSAETVGRDALARNPADAWAAHAVAHVLETDCRQAEGIAFLKDSRPSWRQAHFISGHNGWHLALYLIEEGRFDEVLSDYDRFVTPKLADDATLDRVDAASLLWRLELAGVDVGARWIPVARQWMKHVDDHVLAFNDLHLALAVARADEADQLDQLRRSLDDYARFGWGDNCETMAVVGRRLIDGAVAFAAQDYRAAVDAILPVRHLTIRIGGSHAQRDIVEQTLIAAADRSGQSDLSRSLLAERLAARPTARVKAAYEKAARLAK
jgi:tetratricopeptide (TPR) repeat protein